jgi:hypothetical protein
VIRKAEITFEPDDVDGFFGHKILTEKPIGCFQKEKAYLCPVKNLNVSK